MVMAQNGFTNVEQELSTHAHGQAAMGVSPGKDKSSEDLFASSSGGEGDGPVV